MGDQYLPITERRRSRELFSEFIWIADFNRMLNILYCNRNSSYFTYTILIGLFEFTEEPSVHVYLKRPNSFLCGFIEGLSHWPTYVLPCSTSLDFRLHFTTQDKSKVLERLISF